MSVWRVDELRGRAESLHGRDALRGAFRLVSVLEVDRPAMVLGSTQNQSIVDGDAANVRAVEVVRRQTGGGAVHLAPQEHLWIDLTIPADDPLWTADVSGSFDWLARTWSATLADLGVAAIRVNDTAVCHSVLGRLICFAGLGFGELSTDAGKVVGLAQRRTREGAWFQCTLMRRWDIEPYARVLGPGLAAITDDAAAELAAIRVQTIDVATNSLVETFVRHLPA